MLPLEMYRSPAVLDAEHALILTRSWHCVGRTADIAAPGDHLTGEIPERHDDGTSAPGRCWWPTARRRDPGVRQRVHPPRSTARGRLRPRGRFTCPYHAWVYRLDGQLIGAPLHAADGRNGRPSVRPVSAPTRRARLEVWEGFIFVNAHPDAAPLGPSLAGLADVVGRFGMASYVPVHRQVDVWDTNWKLLVENFMDTYHVFKVHRATFGATATAR